MATKVQIRRDSASDWTSVNPVLTAGEMGYEQDTAKMKVGDGSTAWTSLGYFAPPTVTTTVVANMTALVALTGMSSGDKAFVTANNKLFLYNGSGWYLVATVQNSSPSAITGVNSTYALATDGTATTITAVSTDPEGVPLTWSYAVTTGSLTNGGGASATVSRADNVFTITPTTNASYAGTFSLTFSATDGVTGAVSAASAFTLTFAADWSSTTQQAKLTASDAADYDNFGHDVSISKDGNTVVVGAWATDDAGSASGNAYVFVRSGTSWSQQAVLVASDGASTDLNGYSVGISEDGNTVVTGAHGKSSYTGAAYIFVRSGTTWSQQAKLTDSSGGTSDSFAFSVDISKDGDTVIAGAYAEDTTATNAGVAVIFTRSGTSWSQQARIQSSDIAAGDNFGYDVAIDSDGNTAVIGAYNDADNGTSAGTAFIFTRSGTSWSQQAKLTASDGAAQDYFGEAVNISDDGNTAIIGAKKAANGGTQRGAAYIFIRSGTSWSQQAKLGASNAGDYDIFGLGVALDPTGDTAIIGAQQEDSGASEAGSAYIFTRDGTTWSEQEHLIPSDSERGSNDRFGWSVDLGTDTAIVSTHRLTSVDTGAAYVFIAG
jgi:hypothetical protein